MAHWAWNRRRGWTTARTIDTGDFPGVLAGMTLLEVQDPAGLPVGLTWDQKTHGLTAMIPVQPLGLTLVGAEQVREWVSGWGDWLSHLGYLPGVKHVVVTVHTGPSPPTCPAEPTSAGDGTVVQEVIRQLDVDLDERGPARFSRTLVSITVDVPDRSHLESACTDVVELCGALGSTLGRCGVSVLATMPPHDIVQWLRAVYEPTSSGIAASTNWVDGRPTSTEESWAHYQHDGAVSAAYVWDETPGQRVPPDVLARLLGPSEYHKRVSLVYEPMAAHVAVREVDRQAAAAAFRSQYRRRLGRDETAKERADLRRAEQTATDQVGGAGLVDVGLYAVATAVRPCGTAAMHDRSGEPGRRVANPATSQLRSSGGHVRQHDSGRFRAAQRSVRWRCTHERGSVGRGLSRPARLPPRGSSPSWPGPVRPVRGCRSVGISCGASRSAPTRSPGWPQD